MALAPLRAPVLLSVALLASLPPEPARAQEDPDPCALVTVEEVVAATGVRGLASTSMKSRGSLSCTYSGGYVPTANVSLLLTKNARFRPGMTKVAELFQAERAEDTRPQTDLPGLGIAAYAVEKAVFVLVDEDTQIGAFVPGIQDAAKAAEVARALVEKALERLPK